MAIEYREHVIEKDEVVNTCVWMLKWKYSDDGMSKNQTE